MNSKITVGSKVRGVTLIGTPVEGFVTEIFQGNNTDHFKAGVTYIYVNVPGIYGAFLFTEERLIVVS